MYRQRNPPSAIPMIPRIFRTLREADVQVCAGAEHLPTPGHDDAFDTVVDVEEGEGVDHFALEDGSEGIVVFGAVELEDNYGCDFFRGGGDVVEADLLGGEGRVGGWEREFFYVGDHGREYFDS